MNTPSRYAGLAAAGGAGATALAVVAADDVVADVVATDVVSTVVVVADVVVTDVVGAAAVAAGAVATDVADVAAAGVAACPDDAVLSACSVACVDELAPLAWAFALADDGAAVVAPAPAANPVVAEGATVGAMAVGTSAFGASAFGETAFGETAFNALTVGEATPAAPWPTSCRPTSMPAGPSVGGRRRTELSAAMRSAAGLVCANPAAYTARTAAEPISVRLGRTRPALFPFAALGWGSRP
jgi:hypothetical protein